MQIQQPSNTHLQYFELSSAYLLRVLHILCKVAVYRVSSIERFIKVQTIDQLCQITVADRNATSRDRFLLATRAKWR